MVNIAKRPRPWRRYILIVLAIAGLCATLYYFGRSKYHHWRATQLAHQARSFLDKHDPASAILTVKRGLGIDINSAECWKVLAEVAEGSGWREAIYARSRIIELEGASRDAVIACAETALRFGDPQAAADALGKLSANRREDPQYQALCGRVGAAMGKRDLAVAAYAEAVRLDPKNAAYQMAHASALLDRAWIEDRAAARSTLERLEAVPDLRLAALRALLKDSLANGERASALETARKLADSPGAGLGERLDMLAVLHTENSEEFPSALVSLEKESRGNPSAITSLVVWLNRNGRFKEALAWSNDFSSEEWSDPRVCTAVALSVLASKDWAGLESFTQKGNWQAFEYVRCALLSRALRERGKLMESRQQWDAAVGVGAKVPGAISELAKLSEAWGWDSQCEDLLRILLKDQKEADWAALLLARRLAAQKRTFELWAVTGRIVELDPGNDAAANNFAMYSLLLNKETTRALQMAQKLYEKHPQEAKYASTYAYSLLQRGQPNEALRVMKTLSPESLDAPDIAAYYGLVLAAAGDTEKAREYLRRGATGQLFPEEEELVRRASDKVEKALRGQQN